MDRFEPSQFSPATAAWFQAAFEGPTEVQARGWARIAAGDHALLIAPTGSGKTLAAFLYCIDRLIAEAPRDDRQPGTRVLYVSPLKALAYDVDRNLRVPLRGIEQVAAARGLEVRMPTLASRTGDTPARERRQHLRHPGDILVTTPESLYLMLGSQVRETLRTVETVIVDEVHALAPGKRGAHLSLSLERLAHLCGRDPQRIGLSATARPSEVIAGYLGGDRPVAIVDTSQRPAIDLEIVVPVPDMTAPQDAPRAAPRAPARAADDDELLDTAAPGSGIGESVLVPPSSDTRPGERGLWPAIHPHLAELIRSHHTTILFVNSRGLCERLTQRLNELIRELDGAGEGGPDAVRSHHGSLAQSERKVVEEQLKAGAIRAIVATSSLELGIDMGAVDLVILVESPGSVASGLQRIGRAGHGVGEVSKGRVFPKHRGDLLEATVVARRMSEGGIEAIQVPQNALDVLAQQIVAMVAVQDWSVEDLGRVLRRAAGYAELPDSALLGVLDMLAGRYPSTAFAELKPRIVWDRDRDRLSTRRGAKMISLVNGGTIPDRGLYGVYLGEGGPRVGELDEEMVHETTPGQTFTLGATTWRAVQITRDRVIVEPAPGEQGKLPFWRGDGPGRPIELGRALGAFTRELAEHTDAHGPEATAEMLMRDYHAGEWAAQNLITYIDEQRELTGTVPSDTRITIERFRDEVGDHRVCILTPFGARVHAPWALALESRLSELTGFEIHTMWSDDGIVLRFADADELPDEAMLVPEPEDIDDLLVSQLARSSLFAGQFRENAARALLLPRRRPDARTPLWLQRLKSQQLLAVAREFPSFPIIMETYRSCLQDVFDVPALVEVLTAIRRRDIAVDHAETSGASPFSRSLVFDYVGAYLYEGDAPLAERRAQALSLDRKLLRELLGEEELRALLDGEVIAELDSELQWLHPDRRAGHPDAVHDMLRSLGDLGIGGIAARCADDVKDAELETWMKELASARRITWMRIGGEKRWIAAEDAGLYRDALGAQPPAGLPDAFLAPRPRPVLELFARFARTRGPFEAATLAERYGLPIGQVQPALEALEAEGRLASGEFHPGGAGTEWCDVDVLRRIKRRTLAKLRGEVAPVDAAVLGRFLPEWHGIGSRARGRARLEEALLQLEGYPVAFSELEKRILPARVRDFDPAHLDELGAMGYLVWVGRGALGSRDGKVALYRRDEIARLLPEPEIPAALDDLHRALLSHLEKRGASFFAGLLGAAPGGASQDEVLGALWDLVWAGLITNDTFQPLRAIAARAPGARVKPSRRRPGRAALFAGSGRWSLVRELLWVSDGQPATATEMAHARTIKLLERHGLVTREVASLEPVAGGFSALYPVLRALEEAGKVRRGYFVEGLGGAQFCFPGAVDRLRAAAQRSQSNDEPVVLAATDPANPYGWMLPWPETGGSGTGPRRVSGATVVLVAGEPVLYLDRGAKRAISFPAADRRDALVAAASALVPLAEQRRGKYLRLETIDDEPARSSPRAAVFLSSGFFTDHRGLVLEAR